jgi:hypothetical protein
LKRYEAAKTAAENMKPCFIDAPEPKVGLIDVRLSNAGSFELKIPGCECRVSPGYSYLKTGGSILSEGSYCPCTISPCAVDAFKQLQVQQVTQTGNITKLESAIEEIKFYLAAPPEDTANLANPSPPESIEFASVYAEVYKWLSKRM